MSTNNYYVLHDKNKKAKFDYEFITKYTAGLVLKGTEVKSIKNGSISLKESFISIDNVEGNLEIFLKQAFISRLITSARDHEEVRNIKLLLNKKEIIELYKEVTKKGLTIVPYKIYTDNRRIKIEIYLAKGKTNYDKRHSIKDRDLSRITREEY